ncbi:hypothetical protein [Pseudoalteromonas sp. PPB1]|uniref:hypothetical protein n=1 Tax=Pseudoalteromonas sp. PPB1 TaxID=2756136 RepID=UPI0018912C5D|nr:hypothetical protein [Pseudoalteromonas sp. PPB1]
MSCFLSEESFNVLLISLLKNKQNFRDELESLGICAINELEEQVKFKLASNNVSVKWNNYYMQLSEASKVEIGKGEYKSDYLDSLLSQCREKFDESGNINDLASNEVDLYFKLWSRQDFKGFQEWRSSVYSRYILKFEEEVKSFFHQNEAYKDIKGLKALAKSFVSNIDSLKGFYYDQKMSSNNQLFLSLDIENDLKITFGFVTRKQSDSYKIESFIALLPAWCNKGDIQSYKRLFTPLWCFLSPLVNPFGLPYELLEDKGNLPYMLYIHLSLFIIIKNSVDREI